MNFILILFLLLTESAFAQFSSSGQEAIVKAHNDLRSSIANGTYIARGKLEPSAANMIKLHWDADLEASAQKYAETCPRGHSHIPELGENLYWKWSSCAPTGLDKYGLEACGAWEREFQNYGWESITLDRETYETGIGHATQMAWADTYLIGCGVKDCGRDAVKKNMYRVSVVCQYSPQGNMIDDNIYEIGETCSLCPEYCEASSGLCDYPV